MYFTIPGQNILFIKLSIFSGQTRPRWYGDIDFKLWKSLLHKSLTCTSQELPALVILLFAQPLNIAFLWVTDKYLSLSVKWNNWQWNVCYLYICQYVKHNADCDISKLHSDSNFNASTMREEYSRLPSDYTAGGEDKRAPERFVKT